MAYEIFTRKKVTQSSPTLSLSKLGRIGLNQGATRIFKDKAVEFVLILWDEDNHKMALRPITKKDPRAYSVSYAKKGNFSGFSSKTFLEHIGYDSSETHSFPAKWNENEDVLEIDISKEFIRKTNQDQSISEVKPTTRKLTQLQK